MKPHTLLVAAGVTILVFSTASAQVYSNDPAPALPPITPQTYDTPLPSQTYDRLYDEAPSNRTVEPSNGYSFDRNLPMRRIKPPIVTTVPKTPSETPPSEQEQPMKDSAAPQ